MLTELLVRFTAGRSLVRQLGRQRTEDILGDIQPYLQPRDRIVDVGAGTCDVVAELRCRGFDVVPVDVRDLSCVDGLVPVLFDGSNLPFAAEAFDVALLINVLHHVADPDRLLRETMRVATSIVIHEDIFETTSQRRLTELMDSVTNLEFFGHPHSNRDDAGWRRTFATLGLELLGAKYKTFWRFFTNGTYHLRRMKVRGDEVTSAQSPEGGAAPR